MTIAIAEAILIFGVAITLTLYMLIDCAFAWRPSLQAEHLISTAVTVPLVIMAIVGACWLAGSFRSGGQTDWAQIKDFVQVCVLLVTPTGVALGLHYAGKRTDQMVRQTNAQQAANSRKLFFDALSYLTGSEDHLRLAGLASLRNDIFALNDDFFKPASLTLLSFIRNHGKIPDAVENEPTQARNARIKLVQEAFETFLFLEDVRQQQGKPARQKRESFTDLNLIGIRFTNQHPMINMRFDRCRLDYAGFYGPSMESVSFFDCSLNETEFFLDKFLHPQFRRCCIASASFFHANFERGPNALVGNFYPAARPPSVMDGMMLSPPVHHGDKFMTASEAREALSHEYQVDGPDDEVPDHIILLAQTPERKGLARANLPPPPETAGHAIV